METALEKCYAVESHVQNSWLRFETFALRAIASTEKALMMGQYANSFHYDLLEAIKWGFFHQRKEFLLNMLFQKLFHKKFCTFFAIPASKDFFYDRCPIWGLGVPSVGERDARIA